MSKLSLKDRIEQHKREIYLGYSDSRNQNKIEENQLESYDPKT